MNGRLGSIALTSCPLSAAWPGRPCTTTSNQSDAHLRRGDRPTERLGDDGRVGRVPREHRLQRTVAGALLLDDRLDVDGRARRQAEITQAFHGPEDRRQPAFHVGGTATVEPIVLDVCRERVASPLRPGLRTHHVDVPVEDQAEPADRSDRRPRGDDVRFAVDVPVERRGDRVRAQGGRVHRHVDRLEAELRQRFSDDRLPRLFAAEGGVLVDEPGEELRHPGPALGDRVGDLPVRRAPSRRRPAGPRRHRQPGVGVLGGSDPGRELAARVRRGSDVVGDGIQGREDYQRALRQLGGSSPSSLDVSS